MKSNRFTFFEICILLFSCIFLYSCQGFSTLPDHPDCMPNSRQATQVGSSSSTEIEIRATGKGITLNQANEDSKKAAVWYAINYDVKSTDDKRKVQYKNYLCNPDNYIRRQSDLLKKERIAGKIYLEYIYKIDMEMLKSDLCRFDMICGISENESGISPSIAVFSNPKNVLSPVAVSVIKEYLIDRGYEVFVQDDMSKTNRVSEKVERFLEREPDPFYRMAIKLGTDIYIQVTNISCKKLLTSGVVTRKTAVSIEAMETATDKQIGSTTGESLQRLTPACESITKEATQDAANKIINQIARQLKRQNVRGKPFKIVLLASESNGQTVNKKLYQILKSLSGNRMKILGSGKTQFSYLAYIKGFSNIFELYEKINNQYTGPGVIKKEFSKGAFLILTNNSGDDF